MSKESKVPSNAVKTYEKPSYGNETHLIFEKLEKVLKSDINRISSPNDELVRNLITELKAGVEYFEVNTFQEDITKVIKTPTHSILNTRNSERRISVEPRGHRATWKRVEENLRIAEALALPCVIDDTDLEQIKLLSLKSRSAKERAKEQSRLPFLEKLLKQHEDENNQEEEEGFSGWDWGQTMVAKDDIVSETGTLVIEIPRKKSEEKIIIDD